MLFDNQFRFNVGFYRYTYKDLQIDFWNSAREFAATPSDLENSGDLSTMAIASRNTMAA